MVRFTGLGYVVRVTGLRLRGLGLWVIKFVH